MNAILDRSQLRLLSYQDILEMERLGIISEDEHVELLGGKFSK